MRKLSDPEGKKLLAAMQKDEKLISEEIQKLTAMARRPIKVRVVCGDQETVIEGRRLKDSEVLSYLNEQAKINPMLATDPEHAALTPDESQQLNDLTDQYIEMTTGIPIESLKEIGSIRIRNAIMVGILKASGVDYKELEEIRKFRPAT